MAKADRPFVVASQQSVADFFGVTQPAINRWIKAGAPVMRGKKYDLAAIAKWAINKRVLVGAVSDELGDSDLGEGSSPALEEYRRERAKMARLQRLQLESELVEVAKIEAGMLAVAARIREAGERLQRIYGAEAQTVLNEYLDAAQQSIDAMFAEHRQGDSADPRG